MKKVFLSFIALIVMSFSNLYSQELGDFKPKDDSFKPKKLNKGLQKVYIANFGIKIELYKEAIDKKKAGGFGRTIKNAAKAKAAVGLSTLEKEALQAKSDQLFADFLGDMKGNGYEVISADEAGKTDYYDGWKIATGPMIFETDMPGILSVIPTGYSFYYKDRTALSNKTDGFRKGPQDLSKELNNALIADVSLVYAFSEVGNDWNVGNQAKVKLFINYRLADVYHYSNEKTSTGSLSSLVDKSKQAVSLYSYVNFTRGKYKIGGSAESQYLGALKSSLEIDGVLKKEKVVAYSTQTQATATLQNPVVTIRGDNYSEKTKWLEPDGQKYAKGMYLAGNEFLKYHTGEVFK